MENKRDFNVHFMHKDSYLPLARAVMFVLCILVSLALLILGIVFAADQEDGLIFLPYFIYAFLIWISWFILNCFFEVVHNSIVIRDDLKEMKNSMQSLNYSMQKVAQSAGKQTGRTIQGGGDSATEVVNGIAYRLERGAYTVVSVDRSASVIKIPSQINGIEVRQIGAGALMDCNNLVAVTIRPLLTHIGEGAFQGCKELRTIELHGAVAYVGDNAFAGCSNLTVLAEAEQKPSGWSERWNPDNCPVVWNCKQ